MKQKWVDFIVVLGFLMLLGVLLSKNRYDNTSSKYSSTSKETTGEIHSGKADTYSLYICDCLTKSGDSQFMVENGKGCDTLISLSLGVEDWRKINMFTNKIISDKFDALVNGCTGKKDIANTASIMEYSGTAQDEVGNVTNYVLKIKSDLSEADIQGHFLRIAPLSDGIYQWIEGTVVGMKLRPEQSQCILYGVDGDYFCTLYRRN